MRLIVSHTIVVPKSDSGTRMMPDYSKAKLYAVLANFTKKKGTVTAVEPQRALKAITSKRMDVQRRRGRGASERRRREVASSINTRTRSRGSDY
ncbi:hypothetical protein CVT26_005392 [Gymnopilus dilepis]|uniref:Uncharacterized protein n=1 Tax=Gymnopilus dilepis TaxID=231916 RepID=A0A409WH12_9AGAR|nr:hypothetical protein CVT26_005392 [Gymnopilus dilepis]